MVQFLCIEKDLCFQEISDILSRFVNKSDNIFVVGDLIMNFQGIITTLLIQ